ncbi:lysozyme inhibitor LprI family protein [Phenylobacterium koreense]|uniref:Uncharacterized protein YecT (DUF1311 family) n=2 Tax=Phenylobacterium TaxID=20 RepID=A0ABV2EHD6_9CAUL
MNGKALAGGVALACVLGVGLGLAARPQILTRAIAALAPAAQNDERRLELQMAEPPPEPKFAERPPLETLSPETLEAGQQAAAPTAPIGPPEVLAPAAPEPAPAFEPPPVAEPPWPPEPPRARQAPRPPVAREPAQAIRPSFDCRRAESLAEELICTDAVLAAADRHMARAFDRAVRSGVPLRQLQAEQRDFMAMREDAAQRSPQALASLYDQRIADLNAMADGPDPTW